MNSEEEYENIQAQDVMERYSLKIKDPVVNKKFATAMQRIKQSF